VAFPDLRTLTALTGIAMASVATATPALAQDDGLDPSLPIPTLQYERPPPDFSYEIGVQASYGVIHYWQNEVAPWIGFGIRGGWGRNLPDKYNHRIGANLLLYVEGPMPVHMTIGLEPQLSWDYINKKGLLLGAGIGPAALYHSKIENGTSVFRKAGFGASAAARIGWSQSWTRVGRRLFVMVEPRLRYTEGLWGPSVALVIGSGRGY
jgi:hypothetical protein